MMAKMPMEALLGFQDPVSSFTHLLAAPVFLVMGFFLVRRGRGDRARMFFLSIFAFACVFLLSMSSVYHMMANSGSARAVMERLDHGAIFVLIAGTFTPAFGILYHGAWRWLLLFLIWSSTITAITLKTIFFTGVPEWLGLSLYLGLGWVGLLSAIDLWRRFGYAFIRPLLWGGVAYTVGGVLEFFTWPIVAQGVIGAHELFHLLVLAGMGCHYRFVYQFAAGLQKLTFKSGQHNHLSEN